MVMFDYYDTVHRMMHRTAPKIRTELIDMICISYSQFHLQTRPNSKQVLSTSILPPPCKCRSSAKC